MHNSMIELWRDIPGYEGLYQASSLGRIRSLDREIIANYKNGKTQIRHYKGQILAPGRYNKDGHLSVVLGKGTSGKPVHSLVALTFIGTRPKDCDVRHVDGNPANNRLDNLMYGTRTQNILDVYRKENHGEKQQWNRRQK